MGADCSGFVGRWQCWKTATKNGSALAVMVAPALKAFYTAAGAHYTPLLHLEPFT